MFLKHIDLTTALRPSYLPDEVLLFVQDNVGLYQGYVYVTSVRWLCTYGPLTAFVCRNYKIPAHQNGQVYLTSHRICYVDNEDPRKNSVAIDLKEIERYELYVSQVPLKGIFI
jgi:ESCRT-II complex subunit VPS36